MSKKLFIKFLDVIPTAIGISLIAFLLIRLIPGDPVMLLLGERGSDPVVYEKMKALIKMTQGHVGPILIGNLVSIRIDVMLLLSFA